MKLIEYFKSNKDRPMIHKPLDYFPIYEKHFSRFVGKPVKVLEIGIENGGSLLMWNDYFGKDSEIVGIDINPKCAELELKGFRVYIGDQASESFLTDVVEQELSFDIIIDDGGHYPFQQVASFKKLYPFLSENGIYLCEDLGTNYQPEYGGGVRKPGTFIEMAKALVDEVNKKGLVTQFTKTISSITFYSSVVVFEREKYTDPVTKAIGVKTI